MPAEAVAREYIQHFSHIMTGGTDGKEAPLQLKRKISTRNAGNGIGFLQVSTDGNSGGGSIHRESRYTIISCYVRIRVMHI
jgi:hypothetical protein